MVSGNKVRQPPVRSVSVFSPETGERIGHFHALTMGGELTVIYRGHRVPLEERNDVTDSPRLYPKNPEHEKWLYN